MRIGLVIPILNNFDQALDLIWSAKSENDIRIYIQPQYRYQVPLAQAWNNGIREAIRDNCGVIIVSNDDAIFSPDTVDRLAQAVDEMPDNYVMAFPVDVHDYVSDNSDILFDDFELEGIIENKEDQTYSCFAIKSDFFEKCGKFDENFDPAWWEDADMKYRISLLGYKSLQTQIPYVHLRHQTTQKLNIPINSLKSGEYYQKKWGSARKDLKEVYRTPYNDPNISPKEWRFQ